MSISLRDQTAVIYTPTTTNDGGYASDAYATTAVEYFCRVVEQNALERIATGQVDGATIAMIELADEISVPTQAILRCNGFNYRIRGVMRRPRRRVIQYAVEWQDQPFNGVPA